MVSRSGAQHLDRPAGLKPGPKMRRRLRIKVQAAAGQGVARLERTLLSYRGWLRL